MIQLEFSIASIAYNLLENVPPDNRPALVSRLIGMFRANFGSSWGVRVERLLRFALAALLDQGDATLIRLLDDAKWRATVVAQARDPLTRRYWLLEYPRLDDRLGGELDQPLQNKLSFLASPALPNVLGQARSTFHPRHFMDEGRILIADLSKGMLGDTDSQILGSLLVAGFEQAAMTVLRLLARATVVALSDLPLSLAGQKIRSGQLIEEAIGKERRKAQRRQNGPSLAGTDSAVDILDGKDF